MDPGLIGGIVGGVIGVLGGLVVKSQDIVLC
jgi:hypothetical protein